MLKCHQMAELATDHREGRLSLWQTAQYFLHWAICPPCQTYSDQLEKAGEAARKAQLTEDLASSPDPDPDLLESFRKRPR